MSHTTRITGMISLIVVGASPSLLPELQRALPDSNCLSVADAAGAQAMLAHADASVVLVDFCAAKASQLLRQMDEDPAFDGLALMAAIPQGTARQRPSLIAAALCVPSLCRLTRRPFGRRFAA